jgi:hypothetical protein
MKKEQGQPMDKPDAAMVARMREDVLLNRASISDLFERMEQAGVEQFIRDNGWGNLEWQAAAILKRLERDGRIRLDRSNFDYEILQ